MTVSDNRQTAYDAYLENITFEKYKNTENINEFKEMAAVRQVCQSDFNDLL